MTDRQYFRSTEQVRDWRKLADAASEVGDHLPCRQAPDLYFATVGEMHEIRLAKKACQPCPIRAMCLEYALKHNEHEGIWGGMTASERKKIRRHRRERNA